MRTPLLRRATSTLTGLAVSVGLVALPAVAQPGVAQPGVAQAAGASPATSLLDVVDVELPPSASPRAVTVLGTSRDGRTWTRESTGHVIQQPVEHDASGTEVSTVAHNYNVPRLLGEYWVDPQHDLVRWSHVDARTDEGQEWTYLRTGDRRPVIAAVPGAALVWDRPAYETGKSPVVMVRDDDGTVRDVALPSTLTSEVQHARALDQRHLLVTHEDGIDLVDLVGLHAWTLPTQGICAGDRGLSTATVDGELHVSWVGLTAGDRVTICQATASPAQAGTALEAIATSVDSSSLASLASTQLIQTLPVADGVLAAPSDPAVGFRDLTLVTPEGTVRTVASTMGPAAPVVSGPAGADGRAVVTVALRDGTPTLARITVAKDATPDASASSTIEWLAADWPRSAQVSTIALDGERLAVVDDRVSTRAVTQYDVTPGSGSASDAGNVTETATLSTSPRGDVVLARDGRDQAVTLVGTTAPGSRPSGIPQGHLLTIGDQTRDLQWNLSTFDAADGRWALAGGRVVDLTTGELTVDATRWSGLQQGIVWRTQPQSGDAPPRLVLRNLATGLSRIHEVPRCARSLTAQLAGQFLLAECLDVDRKWLTWVRDLRTETWTPLDRHDSDLHLGNGFILGEAAGAAAPAWLWWLPLNDLTGAPRPVADAPALASDSQVAVSVESASTPSFAWVAPNGPLAAVKVAFPDVTTTPAHTFADGIGLPHAVTVSAAQVGERVARVEWPAPAASEQVASWIVTALTPSGAVHTEAVVAENRTAATRSATLAIPTTWTVPTSTPLSFRVTAQNPVGTTDGVTSRPFPRLAAPSRPELLLMTRDHVGRSTVSWNWTTATPSLPENGVQALTGFRVLVGGAVVDTGTAGKLLAPTARSFRFPDSVTVGATNVVVEAVGALETTASAPVSATITGPERLASGDHGTVTLPKVSMTGTAQMTLTRATSARVRTQDVQVRITPATGKAGSWTSPARLQRIDMTARTRRLDLTGIAAGAQWCVRTRGRDATGTTSQWSTASCTVRAVDDRAFTLTSLSRGVKAKGTRLSGKQYASRTATRLGATGAAGRKTVLVGPRTSGSKGWIVATTCPTCGKVRIEVTTRGASTSSKVIDLRSKKTTHQVLLPVRDLGSIGTGAVRIVRVSGKPVIDAIALHR